MASSRPGRQRGESAEQCGVRERFAELFEGELRCRTRKQAVALERAPEFTEAEVVEALGGVDQDEAFGGEPGEEIDLVEQGDVLDDDGVGLHHRLAGSDRTAVDAAERHDWGAHALGAEARERLGVVTSTNAATERISAAVTTP